MIDGVDDNESDEIPVHFFYRLYPILDWIFIAFEGLECIAFGRFNWALTSHSVWRNRNDDELIYMKIR